MDTYDVLRQHVVSHHFLFDETKQAQLFRSPHRYIWPAGLDLMAQLAGFELETTRVSSLIDIDARKGIDVTWSDLRWLV